MDNGLSYRNGEEIDCAKEDAEKSHMHAIFMMNAALTRTTFDIGGMIEIFGWEGLTLKGN